MSVIFEPDTIEARYVLQQAAREKMKVRLMADVLFDLRVCQLEGWDSREYISDLIETLKGFLPK